MSKVEGAEMAALSIHSEHAGSRKERVEDYQLKKGIQSNVVFIYPTENTWYNDLICVNNLNHRH